MLFLVNQLVCFEFGLLFNTQGRMHPQTEQAATAAAVAEPEPCLNKL